MQRQKDYNQHIELKSYNDRKKDKTNRHMIDSTKER